MATFRICVFEHQERSNGKYPVSIRVTWNRKSAYINTGIYVTKKQLTDSFEVKDINVNRELSKRINGYEDLKLKKLGSDINNYTAKELCDFFVKNYDKKSANLPDFISFTSDVIETTKNKGTANLYQTVVNSIVRYIKKDKLMFDEITVSFLLEYEKWLVNEQLKSTGINLYMRNIRALFNKAREKFNDEDEGEFLITHYPFKKYKIPEPDLIEKRALIIDQIKTIRDIKLKLKRDIMARDVFMLSFYLAGTNTADFYGDCSIKDGRLEYERQKTKSRRKDKAFISIYIPDEAKPLIKKYANAEGEKAFVFHKMYYESRAFNKAVNKGLKHIAILMDEHVKEKKLKKEAALPKDIEFYAARHSFATLARNKALINKYDVHEALNHASDKNMKVTDFYIEKDWSIIDNVVRKVLDLLK